MKLNCANLVVDTLKRFDEKTLDFPGVGKVTCRNPRHKWIVDDEEKLKTYLKKCSKLDVVVETKEVIVKKELNKVLDELEKAHNVKDIPGVIKDPGEHGLTVSYEIKPNEKFEEKKVEQSVKVLTEAAEANDVTELEV